MKKKYMKASEFDRLFEAGEDVAGILTSHVSIGPALNSDALRWTYLPGWCISSTVSHAPGHHPAVGYQNVDRAKDRGKNGVNQSHELTDKGLQKYFHFTACKYYLYPPD